MPAVDAPSACTPCSHTQSGPHARRDAAAQTRGHATRAPQLRAVAPAPPAPPPTQPPPRVAPAPVSPRLLAWSRPAPKRARVPKPRAPHTLPVDATSDAGSAAAYAGLLLPPRPAPPDDAVAAQSDPPVCQAIFRRVRRIQSFSFPSGD